LTVEHKIYPQALRLFAEGKVRMEGGKAVRTADVSDTTATGAVISA
jgi:phosphoribosylglycinamide formyltransferase-1